MDISILIVGFSMIGVGFLVKYAPYLIAGYNTMPKSKKKNVDIEGLATFIRNGLITMGLAIIIGYYLFKWLGFISIANSMIPLITLIGIPVLLIKSQKFDHNKEKKSKLIFISLGLVTLFVIGLITYGFIPSKASYNNEVVRFSGMYGFEINIKEIENIELTNELPAIQQRTNGFSLGFVNKGFFNLDKFGKTHLLLHSTQPPFLILSKNNGDKTIINFKNKTDTENMFNKFNTLKNN